MQWLSRNTDGKPPSLPKNWPHPSREDLQLRPNRYVKIGSDQDHLFHSNFVKTSKYEPWNFLPKFLFEEFHPRTKFANCFFLGIVALQSIKQISNTYGYPTSLLPLLVIVLVDGIFAVVEDRARHKADRDANSSPAHVYNNNLHEFEDVTWAEVQVGNYIRIDTRCTIPADVVILSVAEKSVPPQGVCYVETKSLDGETNLKIRNAIPCTLGLSKDHSYLSAIRGQIEMEHPNKVIEQFSGVIDLGSHGRESIQSNHVLLRGCVLRNTDWVIGVVVNTGHDTKIMMSAAATPSKSSFLEVCASNEIKKIILLLILICVVGATGESIWLKTHHIEKIDYLHWRPKYLEEWVIQFFYFFLLHATFIPVSLYVSMSVTRFAQSYFMNNDLQMYYEKTDTPAKVRTMTLNEELGQISHIFSDKTGTLTCNIMDFRKCSINGRSYGLGITEIGKAAWKLQGKEIPQSVLDAEKKAKSNAVPHVAFYCPTYESDVNSSGLQKSKITQFFKILALCHDVIPENIDGKVRLSASNPDDEALVAAAAYFGFEFKDRKEKSAVVYRKDIGRDEAVDVLEIIGFTSKRKRMSVIIRDVDGVIKILSKGADTMMTERLAPSQDTLFNVTDNHMRDYAQEGLRCLIVGYAEIKPDKFQTWFQKYREASTDMVQIEKRKKGQPNLIEDLQDAIEQNLILVGATAIEDRLQDGVPECITELANAGINIWMLTGDKEETAINIGVACNLVQPKEYMFHIIINKSIAPKKEDMINILETENKKYDEDLAKNGKATKPRALIIDGPSLLTAMDDDGPGGVKSWLFIFGKKCKAVVGCRVSPDQKRQMVDLIKRGDPLVRTLSVGDGANDVAMIQEAHIGVGIKGEEGVQAVNASDFAIAQFRYLSPLLLKHGRYNYIRMSKLILYIFYKNVFMSICQHFFAYMNGFSGQKIYSEAGIQLFNLLFSAFPILLLAVYDKDVSAAAVYNNTQLYISCIKGQFFNSFVFWSWILMAICEGCFVSLMSPSLLEDSDPELGTFNTYLDSGNLTFAAVVIIVNFKIFFLQCEYTWRHFFVIFLSIMSWWAVAFAWESYLLLSFDSDWYQVFTHINLNGCFWLGLLFLVTSVTFKDILLAHLERDLRPKPYHIVQEMRIVSSAKVTDRHFDSKKTERKNTNPIVQPTNGNDDPESQTNEGKAKDF